MEKGFLCKADLLFFCLFYICLLVWLYGLNGSAVTTLFEPLRKGNYLVWTKTVATWISYGINDEV